MIENQTRKLHLFSLIHGTYNGIKKRYLTKSSTCHIQVDCKYSCIKESHLINKIYHVTRLINLKDYHHKYKTYFLSY